MKSSICLLAVGSLGLFATTSCNMGHDEDFAGRHELRSGLSETRAGLEQVRHGVGAYNDGDPAQGMEAMRNGIHSMQNGRASMHAGMGMLSSEMQSHCGAGTTASMGMMDDGLGQMRAGLEKIEDEDASNDQAGMHQMNSGTTACGEAIDSMHESVSCMEHCRGSDMM